MEHRVTMSVWTESPQLSTCCWKTSPACLSLRPLLTPGLWKPSLQECPTPQGTKNLEKRRQMWIGRRPLPVLTSSFPGQGSKVLRAVRVWSRGRARLFFPCMHPRQASHNYLRHASPAYKLFAQPSRDLLSGLASFTVSVHTAVSERHPFSNGTSPHETNTFSSMDAQTLGCTCLHPLGLGTLLWTGSLRVHGVPHREPAWVARYATPRSIPGKHQWGLDPWASIQGPANVPFCTMPKHYSGEGKVAGLTFRIQNLAGWWDGDPSVWTFAQAGRVLLWALMWW